MPKYHWDFDSILKESKKQNGMDFVKIEVEERPT